MRLAFQNGLITNGKIWLEMEESRIETLRGYDEETAIQPATVIVDNYFNLFFEFEASMNKLLHVK